MEREVSFRDYESARDSAALLLVFGYGALFLSVGFFLWCLTDYGPLGWFAYFVGPGTFLTAAATLPFGITQSRKAKRLRRCLHR